MQFFFNLFGGVFKVFRHYIIFNSFFKAQNYFVADKLWNNSLRHYIQEPCICSNAQEWDAFEKWHTQWQYIPEVMSETAFGAVIGLPISFNHSYAHNLKLPPPRIPASNGASPTIFDQTDALHLLAGRYICKWTFYALKWFWDSIWFILIALRLSTFPELLWALIKSLQN